MRLFLSSYRAGHHPKKLLETFGKNSKVAIVSNAKDYKSRDERRESMDEVLYFFKNLGVNPEELDLRTYFKNPKKLADQLNKYDGFWLAGGNAFLLRRALSYTGLDKWLYGKVLKSEVAYGGESAGAIVAGPTLKGSEDKSTNEDHPNFIPEHYNEEVIWDGLNLVNYVPVPHYKSFDQGLSLSIDGYVEYVKDHNLSYKTIEEHQAIIIAGDKEEFLK